MMCSKPTALLQRPQDLETCGKQDSCFLSCARRHAYVALAENQNLSGLNRRLSSDVRQARGLVPSREPAKALSDTQKAQTKMDHKCEDPCRLLHASTVTGKLLLPLLSPERQAVFQLLRLISILPQLQSM